MSKVINVEMYRDNGAAGYLLTWDDGDKTAINAYNSQLFNLEGIESVDCVCGWDEADELLEHYLKE